MDSALRQTWTLVLDYAPECVLLCAHLPIKIFICLIKVYCMWDYSLTDGPDWSSAFSKLCLLPYSVQIADRKSFSRILKVRVPFNLLAFKVQNILTNKENKIKLKSTTTNRRQNENCDSRSGNIKANPGHSSGSSVTIREQQSGRTYQRNNKTIKWTKINQTNDIKQKTHHHDNRVSYFLFVVLCSFCRCVLSFIVVLSVLLLCFCFCHCVFNFAVALRVVLCS